MGHTRGTITSGFALRILSIEQEWRIGDMSSVSNMRGRKDNF
jgi:hypothetical protein